MTRGALSPLWSPCQKDQRATLRPEDSCDSSTQSAKPAPLRKIFTQPATSKALKPRFVSATYFLSSWLKSDDSNIHVATKQLPLGLDILLNLFM